MLPIKKGKRNDDEEPELKMKNLFTGTCMHKGTLTAMLLKIIDVWSQMGSSGSGLPKCN